MFNSFKMCSTVLYIFLSSFFIYTQAELKLDPGNTKVWGPGLIPHKIIMPARYFFIHAVDDQGNRITESPGDVFNITWIGHSPIGQHCRIWLNKLDRNDGSFIIRYKLYHTCYDVQIMIQYRGQHVGNSPYIIPSVVYPEECNCPQKNFSQWFTQYECKPSYQQMQNDLILFPKIDFNEIRPKILQKLNNPSGMSFCNYVIKNNKIYRKCYGQHVGFKVFMDDILLSLTRKVWLPDNEFFINLGDWPLIKKEMNISLPMFSWCGSEHTIDIVLPTYDITEATLENMGRVMLDMLSVQKHAGLIHWQDKIPKVFWRGRDSRRERLQLIDISRKYPDLFNVSLTNFFFYPNEEKIYGPKSKHISFFDYFQYKYQINIDGTVAAYRFPYLLAGNSLVFKQDSNYYEFFYKDLQPMVHYVPIYRNLSNLIEQIEWALNNDDMALKISLNGQSYARNNLLPHDIFCYHALLFHEWSRRIVSIVEVLDDMELVPQAEQDKVYCECEFNKLKDEL